jgi:SAM-dependent methyltransferase
MKRAGLWGVRRDSRTSPEQLQHDFYTATATSYDAEFAREGDPHFVALELISALIHGFDYQSVLDVGAGTGRGVRFLAERHEELEVRGVEPVRAMIEQAERVSGVAPGSIVEASGEALPFEDDSFDAVCELGILHHVADPTPIVQEMTRVARRAIFLSDDNRFAHGAGAWRAVKFALHRLGLWQSVYRLATGGRGYHLSSDGIAYSYSVYDSLELVNEWADRSFLVPTNPARTTWFHPLFSAPNILCCGLRDG